MAPPSASAGQLEARGSDDQKSLERIGVRYAREVSGRGVEGVGEEQDGAPFAVCVALPRDRRRDVPDSR